MGVGKTTLAYKLAEKMEGETLLEDVEENPFLVNFYQNPKQYAFQTQIYFLLRRYHQAKHKSQLGLFKRVLISDYLFDKDRIFAKNNLNDDEFWLYEQLFQVLKKRIAPPDLVIFLQARVEVLVERIKMRKKGYEKNISSTYLENINQAFNEYFFHYSETPLLVSSETPGHAKKAVDSMLGALVGKALGALKSGKGLLPVLVTLQ